MQIDSITPTRFDNGRSVTVTGEGFGSSQGQVLIGGIAQNVNTWSDTSITFTSVRGAQSMGACRVDVVKGSGSVSHGDAVTITGAGFGTNSATTAFIGGSSGVIETTAIGARPSLANWTFGTQWALPQIASDAGRGKVIYLPVTGTNFNGDIRFDSGATIGTSEYVYVTWWAKANVTNFGSPTAAQWKMFRLSETDSISDQDCEITLFKWFGTNGNNLYLRRGGGDSTNYFPDDQYYADADSVWARMEMFVNTGSQGSTSGAVHLACTKSGVRSVYSLDPAEVYNSTPRMRYLLLQNYWGNFGTGAQTDRDTWIDDVYMAVGSWKRVELANNATLSSATTREIQQVTSWNDTSVTVQLNTGGIAAGTHYLHVVDGVGTSLGFQEIEVV